MLQDLLGVYCSCYLVRCSMLAIEKFIYMTKNFTSAILVIHYLMCLQCTEILQLATAVY